jgi:hypothetical protein
MDIQIILAVIGVIATVIFGIWAIIVTFQSSKKVQLTFALDRCTSLLNELSRSLENLIIQYKGKPVGDNLLLLRGYFINTGSRDISPSMVEDKIKLKIPENFEFVEIKVTECSPNLQASVSKLEKNVSEFSTGLWKVKEYFGFDALVNVQASKTDDSPTRSLRDGINFKHRIADSSNIIREQFYTDEKKLQARIPLPFSAVFSSKVMIIVSIIIILLGLSMGILEKLGIDKELGYQVNLDGKNRLVTVLASTNSLTLHGQNGFKKRLTVSEFQKSISGEITIVPKRFPLFMVVGITYSALGALMFFLGIHRSYRQGRLKKFINVKTNKKHPE